MGEKEGEDHKQQKMFTVHNNLVWLCREQYVILYLCSQPLLNYCCCHQHNYDCDIYDYDHDHHHWHQGQNVIFPLRMFATSHRRQGAPRS